MQQYAALVLFLVPASLCLTHMMNVEDTMINHHDFFLFQIQYIAFLNLVFYRELTWNVNLRFEERGELFMTNMWLTDFTYM